MTTPTYVICVRVDEAYADQTPTCLLRKAIALTLQQHDISDDSGVTLLVTGDEEVRKLNAMYRDVDAPTDVLSFPTAAEQDDFPPGAGDDLYLGDIIVAFPYTAAHAREDGHALDHVLALLAVHGTLHLLGYDHDTAESQAEMWAQQALVLGQLDIPADVIPPPYDFSAENDA
ncbi:MAG: rRNA maturation RNase YbeY [Anaerolineae bacterium]|nr:rRNA maturation RNase YbeY [Anaerolineae bacterium]